MVTMLSSARLITAPFHTRDESQAAHLDHDRHLTQIALFDVSDASIHSPCDAGSHTCPIRHEPFATLDGIMKGMSCMSACLHLSACGDHSIEVSQAGARLSTHLAGKDLFSREALGALAGGRSSQSDALDTDFHLVSPFVVRSPFTVKDDLGG